MKRPPNRLSRFNQPRPCRKCKTLTTWSQSNGYCDLGLCHACFNEATAENDHLDNHYQSEPPVPGCPWCLEREVAQ